MIKVSKNINISYSLLFIIFFAIFGHYLDIFLISYFLGVLHEISHIIVAKFFKIKITRIECMAFGVRAILDDLLIRSPNCETIIAIFGPISNLLMIYILNFINKNFSNIIPFKYYDYAVKFNFFTMILNLLPILPLDGGRVLRSQLSKRYGLIKTYNIVNKFSTFLTILLLAFSLYLFCSSNFNFSLMLIGVFLLSNLTHEEKMSKLVFIKETMNNKEKFNLNDINKITNIAASENFHLVKLLKYFTYDSYHFISVIDDTMKIKKVVTETEVINDLVKNGTKKKIEKYLTKIVKTNIIKV